MKKRMILLLLYCSLIAAQISNVSASETVTMALPRDPEITPCWNYISSVYSNLTNDNSGVATVYCYVNGKIGSTTRIEITADLQRYDNGRWITINRFAAASDSHRATLSHTHTLAKGYTYRFQATVTAYSGTSVESDVVTSGTVAY